jgi:hypothetical protein
MLSVTIAEASAANADVEGRRSGPQEVVAPSVPVERELASGQAHSYLWRLAVNASGSQSNNAASMRRSS